MSPQTKPNYLNRSKPTGIPSSLYQDYKDKEAVWMNWINPNPGTKIPLAKMRECFLQRVRSVGMIPDNVLSSLTDSIERRKIARAFYSINDCQDAGHDYFLQMLEEIHRDSLTELKLLSHFDKPSKPLTQMNSQHQASSSAQSPASMHTILAKNIRSSLNFDAQLVSTTDKTASVLPMTLAEEMALHRAMEAILQIQVPC